MIKRRHSKALPRSHRKTIKEGESSLTKCSPFSVKNFNRYKAKVSHVAETCNRKAHQMDINVKRNLLTKFHKDERNVFFFLKSKLTEFVKWLSQALIHEKLIHREIPIRVPPPLPRIKGYSCTVLTTADWCV